jgi:hypothetical protein
VTHTRNLHVFPVKTHIIACNEAMQHQESSVALQGRPKHRRGSGGGAHLRTDVSPSGRERSEEEEQAIINAIMDENTRSCAMKCADRF